MERRFKVEAKSFFFSTKASQLRLEERRKGFLGLILVDLRGATWLATTVDEASRSPASADFVRSSSEGRKSLSVRGGCNKGGRFLEVVVFVDDERKGIIWIPEARSGRGWRRFVTELRSWLATLTSVHGFSSEVASKEKMADEGSSGGKNGRSYADVVRSQSCGVKVGPQFRSTQDLDLFPVSNSFEVGYDVWEASFARVCFEVETATPPMSAVLFREEHPPQFEMPASSGYCSTAAAEEKGKLSKEGIFVISWLWKHLGLPGHILDRVVNGLGAGLLDGLQEKPIDGSYSGQVSGLISRSGSGPDPESSEVLCSVWVPVSSGPGFVADSGVGVGPVSGDGDGVGASVGDGVAGDGFVPVAGAGDGIVSADGHEVSSGPGSVADSGVGVGPVSGDGDGVGSSVGDGVVAGIGPPGRAAAVAVAGDGFVPTAGDGIASADGHEVGPVVSVGFAAGGGPTGFAVADFAAGDGVALVTGDEVGSSISGAGESASSLANERSSSECSSSSDISEECSSPGSAENEIIGDVTVTKSLAVSVRKDSQAWFFGWVRANVQHDEKLLAKLDVIEERSRRTKLVAFSSDRTREMLQMQEKLVSMDVERGRALATVWLSKDKERL
jgi:hypothetical protein